MYIKNLWKHAYLHDCICQFTSVDVDVGELCVSERERKKRDWNKGNKEERTEHRYAIKTK